MLHFVLVLEVFVFGLVGFFTLFNEETRKLNLNCRDKGFTWSLKHLKLAIF